MVHIQQRALRALKQNLFAIAPLLIQHAPRRLRIRENLRGNAREFGFQSGLIDFR